MLNKFPISVEEFYNPTYTSNKRTSIYPKKDSLPKIHCIIIQNIERLERIK